MLHCSQIQFEIIKETTENLFDTSQFLLATIVLVNSNLYGFYNYRLTSSDKRNFKYIECPRLISTIIVDIDLFILFIINFLNINLLSLVFKYVCNKIINDFQKEKR